MTENSTAGFTAGRFRSLTGLSDKALRLYAERGILVPAAVDPATGYRSYAADQVRDGIALDLLRRSKIPLEDLDADSRFAFEDHRAKVAMRRAMEDFSLDLAERVATGDPAGLVARVSDEGPAHWIACEVPFGVPTSPDDLEETFTALAVDLPHVDAVLVETLHAENLDVLAESWTTVTQGAAPRLRVAHRVTAPVSAETLRRMGDAVATRTDARVRVTSGTLPPRREVVYSAPVDDPTDDEGLADTTLSYLATTAFAHLIAEEGVDAVQDIARRRVAATSLFDPSATPEDVFDLTRDSVGPTAF
jgi:DNA-binding transcriptional MerR regulator